MPTSYPGGLDNFTNPTASDTLDSATVPHAAQHANLNDAVEAVQSFLGTTSSPNVARLASANTFTVGGQFISNAVAADVPLTVRGAASQSAALTVWNDSANVQVARVDQGGSIRGGSFGSVDSGKALLTPNGLANGFLLSTNGAANRGLTVRGSASQSAQIFDVQTSAGTSVFRTDDFGSVGTIIRSLTSIVGDWAISVSNSYQSVISANASWVASTIRGAASQTANLQEWQNSAGTVLGSMSPSGFMTTSNGFRAPFFSLSGSVGPVLDFSTVSNSLLVTQRTSGAVGMAVRGASGQSANLQEWQNDSGVAQSWIDNTGLNLFVSSVRPRSTPTTGAFLALNSNQAQITQQTAGAVAFIIRGAASQSANLQDWQDNAGTTLGYFSAAGVLYGRGLQSGSASFSGVTWNGISNPTGTTSLPSLVVKAITSQTANLQEWQDSSGTVIARVSASGDIFGRIGYIGTSVNQGAMLNVNTFSSANVGLVVRGQPSQSGNLQEWQDSAGTILANVSSAGLFTSPRFTAQPTSGTYGLYSVSQGASAVPIVARGAASQTAALTEWQNSGGTVLAQVTAAGNLFAALIRTNNNRVTMTEENGGGNLMIRKSTSTPPTPGASDFAKIYLRDGTNAGTLKLVVIAGTSGAETTILDNIPQ